MFHHIYQLSSLYTLVLSRLFLTKKCFAYRVSLNIFSRGGGYLKMGARIFRRLGTSFVIKLSTRGTNFLKILVSHNERFLHSVFIIKINVLPSPFIKILWIKSFTATFWKNFYPVIKMYSRNDWLPIDIHLRTLNAREKNKKSNLS